MKLYVITIEDVYEGNSNHTEPIVRTSIKEARKELNRLYRSSKETLSANSGMTYDKGKDCFSIYEDGYYCQNHYDAVINTIEVPNIRRKNLKK